MSIELEGLRYADADRAVPAQRSRDRAGWNQAVPLRRPDCRTHGSRQTVDRGGATGGGHLLAGSFHRDQCGTPGRTEYCRRRSARGGAQQHVDLALLDAVHRQKRIWQQAALEQALLASLAVILTGLAGLLIVVKQPLPLWHVGLGTIAIPVIYVLGMRVVLRQEDVRRRAQQLEGVVEAEVSPLNRPVMAGTQKRAVTGFTLAALGILVAAPLRNRPRRLRRRPASAPRLSARRWSPSQARCRN